MVVNQKISPSCRRNPNFKVTSTSISNQSSPTPDIREGFLDAKGIRWLFLIVHSFIHDVPLPVSKKKGVFSCEPGVSSLLPFSPLLENDGAVLCCRVEVGKYLLAHVRPFPKGP